jgi:penicillin-binding protein 1A
VLRRRHPRLRQVARALLVLVLAGVVGTGTFVAGLLAAPIDLAVAPPPTSVLLLASDGRQFATLLPPERQELVRAEDIPQVMREAIMSAEDERFLTHRGVDVVATVRALVRDLTGSGPRQGGSTITQQYVKNQYVGTERTILRKVREAALALRLEHRVSKEQILTDYLNALYLGNGTYGVQAAARYYFGVPVKDLDLDRRTGARRPLLGLARASMLAGIAPAPSAWNPVRDLTTARVRQQYTLNRMVVGGYVTPQQASDAYQLDVRPLRERAPETPTVAPEFADYVRKRVLDDPTFDEDRYFRGGLRVRTTLDLDLQEAFNRALATVLPDDDDPQAAIVAVDYRNGDIKAMATLRRVPAIVSKKTGKVVTPAVTSYVQRLGFNLAAAAQRSTGSTIKPFTLAVALQQGMSLGTTRYAPARDSIPNPGGSPNPYVYGNADVRESGRFTLRRALADSVNTVFVPLAIEVGRSKVARLAEAAGLQGSIASLPLSFGLGAGVNVTPLSQAVAYGAFASGGVAHPPRSFTVIREGATGTDPGRVLREIPAGKATRVMPAGVAADVVEAMTDVVRHGTGTRARQPFTVFGKTGTTNGSTDAWFVGCIPDQHVCIATWMGYDYSSCTLADPTLEIDGACGGMKNVHGVRQVYGGTLPAKVFATAQEQLRRVKAERAALAAGEPLPSFTPAPTRKPSPRATAKPSASPSRRPSPRPSPTASPTPAPGPPTPPVILPTAPPSPSASPP